MTGKSTKRRGRILFLLKCLVAAGLLALVLRQVHWHDFAVSEGRSFTVLAKSPSSGSPDKLLVAEGGSWWRQQTWRSAVEFEPAGNTVIRSGFASSIHNMDFSLFACALLSFFVSTFVLAARWKVLLNVQRIRMSMWEVIRLTFLGDFFNTLMPGLAGGYLVKAYYGAKQRQQTAGVVVSLFVDRLLGMGGLALQSAVMLVVVWRQDSIADESLRTTALSVTLVFLGVLTGLTFVISASVRRRFGLRNIYGRMRVARHLDALGGAAAFYRHDLRYLFSSVVLTIVSQLFWIGSVALTGMSLHLTSVEWSHYFLYVPLIFIIGAVPLAPGGCWFRRTVVLDFLCRSRESQQSARPLGFVATHRHCL